MTTDRERVVQLPPRLVQPARLDLSWVPGATGNPILGWVLPNHLDEGLSVYGTDGTAYGELSPATDPTGVPFVNWAPAAAGPYPTLPALLAAEPALGGFLSDLASAGTAAFSAFIEAVDETLWTVDPLGARSDTFLSVLLGRPLAVVAASIALELESDAYRDPSWPFTFGSQQPHFVGYQFPVRLGDLGFRQDGLLGYFLDGDYTHFNAVHVSVGRGSEVAAGAACVRRARISQLILAPDLRPPRPPCRAEADNERGQQWPGEVQDELLREREGGHATFSYVPRKRTAVTLGRKKYPPPRVVTNAGTSRIVRRTSCC